MHLAKRATDSNNKKNIGESVLVAAEDSSSVSSMVGVTDGAAATGIGIVPSGVGPDVIGDPVGDAVVGSGDGVGAALVGPAIEGNVGVAEVTGRVIVPSTVGTDVVGDPVGDAVTGPSVGDGVGAVVVGPGEGRKPRFRIRGRET